MIERRQELALRAALYPKPAAVAAWRRLREATTIEELDHSVTRILPSVYRNIKEELIGNDLLKLKGSVRHTWAKNVELLRQLEPLIAELTSEAINYRILKGGAINLLFNTPDSRIMGDIDILISKSDFARVRNALLRAGFTPKYAIACPHQSKSRSNLDLGYINGKSLEIDLHIAEERAEAALFKRMLRLPAQTTQRGSLNLNYPQTELLIIHAIVHGLLAVESEDLAQTMLDVELLIPSADLDRLKSEVIKLELTGPFNEYLGLREQIMSESEEISIKPVQLPRRPIVNPIKWLQSMLFFLITLARAIRYRSPRIQDWRRIWKGRVRNRILYLLWLYSGLIRQLELVVTSRVSGFLPRNYPDRKLSPVAPWANDWRFRVTNSSNSELLEISLESVAFLRQSFLIFSNGKLVAVTAPNSLGKYRLVIKNPGKNNEVSIRLPFSGCRQCARDLSDLKISD